MADPDETGWTDNPRDRVLSMANLLWPSPASASLARWKPRPSRDVRSWQLLPGPSHPWWLLPVHRREAAQALDRHDHGQRSGAVWKLLGWLHRNRILQRIPTTRLHIRVPPDTDTIETELARLFETRVDVCVRLGRRRTNRSIVLRPIDPAGRTLCFAKVAETGSGREALSREAANLERVRPRLPEKLRAPQLIDLRTWHDTTILVMAPLLPEDRPDADDGVPADVMLQLARSGDPRTDVLSSAGFWPRHRSAAQRMAASDARAVILDAIDHVTSTWPDTEVPIGSWHGDWVAWNMARSNGHIQLWDWEHFEDDVPVGWDLIHYRAQEIRTLSGTTAADEDAWFAESRALLRQHVGADSRAAAAIIFTYLLEINLRYLIDRESEGEAMTPRDGWGLPLLARLTGETV